MHYLQWVLLTVTGHLIDHLCQPPRVFIRHHCRWLLLLLRRSWTSPLLVTPTALSDRLLERACDLHQIAHAHLLAQQEGRVGEREFDHS